MPRLLKLLSPRKSQRAQPPPPGLRRLSVSKSTGDLVGLLQTECPLRPLVPGFGTKKGSEPPPPNPLALDDSVTCGYLYRLTYTGIWFTLWMELRFSYLLCFYEQSDNLPMDMTNLHGYTVRMAPECDHLEGLFPIKLIKQGERTIFLFADSEEGRIEWMAAFFRASSHRLPLTIEGLNLEFEGNDVARSNSVTTLIRNIPDKKPEDAGKTVQSQEREGEYPEETDEFEDTYGEMKERSSPNPDAVEILNKYETAQALTEHEALRLKTYYWQRRLSTQIKVQTLKEQLETEPKSEPVSSVKQAHHKIVEEQLLEMEQRLTELNAKKEQAEKNVELTLHELEAKKAEELKSAKLPSEPHEPPETKIKLIEKHKPKTPSPTSTPEPEVPLDEHKSKGFFKKRPSPLKLSRHKTFSPGDWAQHPSTPNGSGNGNPPLKKAGSFTNLFHSLTTPSPHNGSSSPKTKRHSPLRLISNLRANQHKRTQSSDFFSKTPSPMTSPVTTPLTSPLTSPGFIISSSGVVDDGAVIHRHHKDKSPRQLHWRHSSYEKYLSPASEYSPSFTLTPDPLIPLTPTVTKSLTPNGSPYQVRRNGSPHTPGIVISSPTGSWETSIIWKSPKSPCKRCRRETPERVTKRYFRCKERWLLTEVF